ncbi:MULTISPECIES: pyrophosphatase [Acinetobacter]|uniref:pyrophosphatase n=1 Tax=Acinetobacter TaxID=469 RepID=UPI0022EADBEB|nr:MULTISPECIES: pyrophosphatase [Acinetobacter]MDA3451082.1 pyrophosphatase [Acinetobacter sp. AOR43_HL]
MILVDEYIENIRKTNKLDGIDSLLLGLVGEIGSLMSPAKKLAREHEIYGKDKFRNDTIEELGDILWYFVALCEAYSCDFKNYIINLDSPQKSNDEKSNLVFTSLPEQPVVGKVNSIDSPEKKQKLLEFASQGMKLVDSIISNNNVVYDEAINFLKKYQEIIIFLNISFYEIVESNIKKTASRFLDGINEPIYFDEGFDEDEQIPREFEIHIILKNNKTYMKWNGVRIGDPLTDNHASKDGYKYHDVFHLAYAAILHWSPVFRALIKHKRKSNPFIDETQDGGRAIVIEEGISVWLYAQAKEHNYFENTSILSYDILKTIQQFIKGYEVEKCSLSLWEKAILEGYKEFNQLKEKGQGKIIGNLDKRTIEYHEF